MRTFLVAVNLRRHLLIAIAVERCVVMPVAELNDSISNLLNGRRRTGRGTPLRRTDNSLFRGGRGGGGGHGLALRMHDSAALSQNLGRRGGGPTYPPSVLLFFLSSFCGSIRYDEHAACGRPAVPQSVRIYRLISPGPVRVRPSVRPWPSLAWPRVMRTFFKLVVRARARVAGVVVVVVSLG